MKGDIDMQEKKIKCPNCGWWVASESKAANSIITLRDDSGWDNSPDYTVKCKKCGHVVGISKIK